MACYNPWSTEQQQEWEAWIATRPPLIQSLARRFLPNHLYRLTSSNHRVFPLSYNENGTITVYVSGRFNLIGFERSVFGVSPENLIECDLPSPDEPVGVPVSEEGDISAYIERDWETGLRRKE